MLQADIDQINSLATILTAVATAVDAIDIRTPAKGVGPDLPGTPLGSACELATEYAEGAWLRTAQRINNVAASMRQAASDFAVTDAEFARRLDEFDFHGAR